MGRALRKTVGLGEIVATVGIALVACLGTTESPPPAGVTVTLGPAGGTIPLPDGAGTLTVPAGALTEDVGFTVAVASGTPMAGLLVQGTVFSIEPAVSFLVPATLALSFQGASLPPGVRGIELAIHRVEGVWRAIEPSTLDAEGTSVQAGLTATDTVGLLGRAASIISVSPAAADLFVGDSLQFRATPLDGGGSALSNRAIAWSSSNPALVQVSNDGKVRALGEGGASISAFADSVESTVLIEVQARPPQSALYPNQPPGATVLMDYDTDFAQIAVPPWDLSTGTVNLETVTDATAPLNPSVVGRVKFSPGCCGGVGPARLETYSGPGRGTPPPGWRRWYISDWVKLSSGWSPNAEGLHGIFRIFANAGDGVGSWIIFRLDGAGPYQPRVAIESPALTAAFGNGAVTAIAGQWYHFEAVIHISGRIQFWVNNVAIYDDTPTALQFAGEFLTWSWEYGGVTPYGGATDGFIFHNHFRSSYAVD
jgi:hypothetical protein